MATYKNIKIKKRGGGTRLQRVQVLKSGKYKFVRNQSKGPTSKKKSKSNPNKRGNRKTANNRQLTVPIAIVAPVVGSFFMEGKTGWGGSPYKGFMDGNYKAAMDHIIIGWTGLNPQNGKFDFATGAVYLKMTIIGGIVHWIASKLGINRMLGRAKVPFIRI